jgi:cysteine synthase
VPTVNVAVVLAAGLEGGGEEVGIIKYLLKSSPAALIVKTERKVSALFAVGVAFGGAWHGMHVIARIRVCCDAQIVR